MFQDKAVVHNVSGTLASSDYTVFPGIDLPGYAMTPVRLTNTSNQDEHPSCSTHSSALRLAQVDACAASMASGPDCYIDTALYMVGATVLLNLTTCVSTLALALPQLGRVSLLGDLAG